MKQLPFIVSEQCAQHFQGVHQNILQGHRFHVRLGHKNMKQLLCLVSEYRPGQELDGTDGTDRQAYGGGNANTPPVKIWQMEKNN